MSDRKEYLKNYRLEHKEKYKEYQRKYRKTHLSTYELLKKENQELKKQLEEAQNDYCKASKSKHERAVKIFKLENQQKEFIKFLEDNEKNFDIKANGMGASSERDELIIKARAYREILSKYKEIIGEENEK